MFSALLKHLLQSESFNPTITPLKNSAMIILSRLCPINRHFSLTSRPFPHTYLLVQSVLTFQASSIFSKNNTPASFQLSLREPSKTHFVVQNVLIPNPSNMPTPSLLPTSTRFFVKLPIHTKIFYFSLSQPSASQLFTDSQNSCNQTYSATETSAKSSAVIQLSSLPVSGSPSTSYHIIKGIPCTRAPRFSSLRVQEVHVVRLKSSPSTFKLAMLASRPTHSSSFALTEKFPLAPGISRVFKISSGISAQDTLSERGGRQPWQKRVFLSSQSRSLVDGSRTPSSTTYIVILLSTQKLSSIIQSTLVITWVHQCTSRSEPSPGRSSTLLLKPEKLADGSLLFASSFCLISVLSSLGIDSPGFSVVQLSSELRGKPCFPSRVALEILT